MSSQTQWSWAGQIRLSNGDRVPLQHDTVKSVGYYADHDGKRYRSLNPKAIGWAIERDMRRKKKR